MKYVRNVSVAVTQLLSAVVGLSLNANETTSGAAYRRRYDGLGWLYKTINALFFWQHNHCKAAAENEIKDCLEILEHYKYVVLKPNQIDTNNAP